ncbi:MAG: class I SAM-dependent methyltransferase [Acidobacteria bacterium]|nr:class I SAM-dependent methyltransferase [Acidobacteriota bacterium]
MKKADYGIDAPGVIRNLAFGSLGAAAAAVLGFHLLHQPAFAVSMIWVAGFLGFEVIAMLWTSLKGKRLAARKLVDLAELNGSERVLDVGCGRGLLLIEAAKRLKGGRAVGLDIWNQEDLSGNGPEATRTNLEAEGASDRAELVDGNAMAMPFPDGSFEVVVSSLCLHNLYQAQDRAKALAEIVRVLKPGGRAVIQDFRHTAVYANTLREAGLEAKRHLVNPLLMFPPTWRVVAKKTKDE